MQTVRKIASKTMWLSLEVFGRAIPGEKLNGHLKLRAAIWKGFHMLWVTQEAVL